MASELEEQRSVEKWLRENEESAAGVVGRWLMNHPSRANTLLKRISENIGENSKQTENTIISLDVQQEAERVCKHLASPKPSRLRQGDAVKMTKNELFVELLRDVVSPNFNIDILSHKILVNVMLLVNADRSSLFLADEGQTILVSRLFDVTEDSVVEDSLHDDSDAIKIPFGNGIAGHVAESKTPINIPDAYSDPRFNQQVDKFTGYKTKSILCMPILAPDGQVIGVAQVINKKSGGPFTKGDEEEFQMFMTFCAIGLLNAQLLDRTFYLSRRLKVLLDLARGLFEETANMDAMMTKVMKEAQELIPCEHCTVVIVDQENTEEIVFTQAFEMEGFGDEIRSVEIGSISDIDLVKQVAQTGKCMMVKQGVKDTEVTMGPGSEDAKSIMCSPIFNKDHKTIGVAKLTNKLSGSPFEKSDEEVFQVFAVFCGLAMHSVINYEKILKANARQKVALEVLSFHASAPIEEAERVMKLEAPKSLFNDLHMFEFDDFPLSDDETVMASVRMFKDSGLASTFRIDDKVLHRWVLTVKKNYRPVTYHNWRHAFNVAQSMYTIFASGGMNDILTDQEKLALLVGCFCHDLDHRGTNNAFQSKMGSALADLYSTSTMEHHHFDHSLVILTSDGNEILGQLTTAQHTEVTTILESAILSTDLALYFKKKGRFQELVKNSEFDWQSESHRDLLRGMLMTACDVAAITKPWEIQKRVATAVATEFFEQGDREREELHAEPMAMMDRRKKHELPKMQVGFIDFICLPLYQPLADLHEGLLPLLEGVQKNRQEWQYLAENPDPSIMGSEPNVPGRSTRPQRSQPASRRRFKLCSLS